VGDSGNWGPGSKVFTTDELIQQLSGYYFLNTQGVLSRNLADGGFAEQSHWSEQLADVFTEILLTLEKEPHKDNLLVALTFPTTEDKPWKSPTLLFTDYVVETLYPVHGVRTGVLTTFQKRNREHSVFQGAELLLNYRRETFPERPVFCPVFLDHQKTFATYDQMLAERGVSPQERDLPALEVINLFGLTPSDNPNYPRIAELCREIALNAIKKQMRKDLEFSIDSDVPDPAPQVVDTGANPFLKSETSTASDGVSFSLQNDTTEFNTPAPANFVAEPAPEGESSATQQANPFSTNEQVHRDVLRRFSIFAKLDHTRVEQLANQLSLDHASPGSQLIRRGTIDQWFYFLVEGMVVLRAADGNSRRIEAGSDPAQQPLSRLLPRKYDVTAMTSIRYIRIHQTVLEKFVSI